MVIIAQWMASWLEHMRGSGGLVRQGGREQFRVRLTLSFQSILSTGSVRFPESHFKHFQGQ